MSAATSESHPHIAALVRATLADGIRSLVRGILERLRLDSHGEWNWAVCALSTQRGGISQDITSTKPQRWSS